MWIESRIACLRTRHQIIRSPITSSLERLPLGDQRRLHLAPFAGGGLRGAVRDDPFGDQLVEVAAKRQAAVVRERGADPAGHRRRPGAFEIAERAGRRRRSSSPPPLMPDRDATRLPCGRSAAYRPARGPRPAAPAPGDRATSPTSPGRGRGRRAPATPPARRSAQAVPPRRRSAPRDRTARRGRPAARSARARRAAPARRRAGRHGRPRDRSARRSRDNARGGCVP